MAEPTVNTGDFQEPYFLGVDVGGTNIKIGLIDDLGQTLVFMSIATNPADGPQRACERVAAAAETMAVKAGIRKKQIVRSGLGTPGPMCLKRGMLLTPTNLPSWHQFPARAELSNELGMPVSFVNDANAAAFGEYWIGTGSQFTGLALLTLGTGVGGGLITEGKLINGVNSFGSELGHMIVDSSSDARLCKWGGGKGQLEAYASASAVRLRAAAGLADGVATLIAETATAESVTALDVYQAATKDDKFALEIVDETAFYLGVGVTGAVHAIDPGLVVLGGAMNFGGRDCPIGQRFLEGVISEFKSRTFENVFEGTQIDFASLGGDAGYIGAAGVARQDYQAL
ncbi:MAG TPA: ROK family protein [Planctomycetaceae bacterium]|nr:ROK family protein [Planctomycetaceae bacterium]